MPQRPTRLFQKFNSISLLLAIIVTVCAGAILWPSGARAPQESNRVSVANETSSLEVINLQRDGETIHLTLRNGYSKSITGFQVEVGRVTVQSELAGTDETFLPGALQEKYYPAQSNGAQESVRVLAVVFEDGTSDGHPVYVKQIKDKRLGEKTQLGRALPLVRKALESADADTEALDKLRNEMLALKVEKGDNLSDDFSLGLHDRKSHLIQQIEKLRHHPQSGTGVKTREQLTELKSQLEKTLSKL